MKNSINFFALLLVLLMTISIFASYPTSIANAKDEQIVIKLGGWYTKDSLDAVENQVNKYSKLHPNIKVVVESYPDSSAFFQNLQAQIASKTAPDVFLIEPNVFTILVESNAIAPVDEIMKEVGYNTDDIYDALINGYKVDGNLYAIPSDFNMLALYYNKDMLAKAGVKVPRTYQELKEAAKKLTSDKVYGLNVDPIIGRIMPILEAFGGKIVKDCKIKINNKGKVEGMKFLLDLYNADKSAVTCKVLGTGWPGETFATQKAAMTISGTWTMGYLRNTVKDFDWGIVPMPEKDGQSAQLMFSGAYAVASSSRYKKEAVEFLKWYLSPESVLEGFKAGNQSIPVQKSYKDEVIKAFPKLELVLTETKFASMFYFGKQGQLFRDVLNAKLEELVYRPGVYSIQEIFGEVQNQFE